MDSHLRRSQIMITYGKLSQRSLSSPVVTWMANLSSNLQNCRIRTGKTKKILIQAYYLVLQKKPPVDRVSAVFDSLCVSEASYEKLRDDLCAERARRSLDNPTQAMLDVMAKMKRSPEKAIKRRKRYKSFNIEEKTENTPAMMEVLRKKKIKMAKESSDESEVEFPALVRPKLAFSEKITTEVISPTVKRTGTRKTELEKLEIEPLQRRRKRGDQTAANREIRSNLRP